MCGCAKETKSCATCLFGRSQGGDNILCEKFSHRPGRPEPRMTRGQMTLYTDGAVRTGAGALCLDFEERLEIQAEPT